MIDEEVEKRINELVQQRLEVEIQRQWWQFLLLAAGGVIAIFGFVLLVLDAQISKLTRDYVSTHFESYDTHTKALGLSARVESLRQENEDFLSGQKQLFDIHIEDARVKIAQLADNNARFDEIILDAKNELNDEQARATLFADTLRQYDHFSMISDRLEGLTSSFDEIKEARAFLTTSYNRPSDPTPGNVSNQSSCLEAISYCDADTGFFAVSGACERQDSTSFALVSSGPLPGELDAWRCEWCPVSNTETNPNEQSRPPTLFSQAICLSVETFVEEEAGNQ